MDENVYEYKGFDILNSSKKDKMKNEYFNPYGYNIYSSERKSKIVDYDIIHTNQNNKTK